VVGSRLPAAALALALAFAVSWGASRGDASHRPSELAHLADALVAAGQRCLATVGSELAVGIGHGPYDEVIRGDVIRELTCFDRGACRLAQIARLGSGDAWPQPYALDRTAGVRYYGGLSSYRPARPVGLTSAFWQAWRAADRVERPLYRVALPRTRAVWDLEVCPLLREIRFVIESR
jgi:hypothetical protein